MGKEVKLHSLIQFSALDRYREWWVPVTATFADIRIVA